MRILKDLTVAGVGLVAAIYLVYPSLGIFEFIPDALPLVGNLDEATATVLLVSAFRYYGVDLSRLFNRDSRADDDTQQLPPPRK